MDKNQLNALKESITTAMADQEFLKKVAGVSSTEEIRVLLAEKGIEATVEQIEAIIGDGRVFGEKAINDNGEIDLEALEQVAGGGPVGGAILGGIFLVGGTMLRSQRTLAAAGIAFAIGCCAPCP